MSTLSFVKRRAIFYASAFLLSFHAGTTAEVGRQSPPELIECTKEGIADCYTGYDNVFQRRELQMNAEGQFNEEAYRRACSALDETSSCYVGFTRCPESMRSNFTRREEGYRMFRTFVCNTEALKAAISIKNCTDPEKIRTCIVERHGNLNRTDARFEEILCRWLEGERDCYKNGLSSVCPWSLEEIKASVARSLNTLELLHDCRSTYGTGAIASTSTDGGRGDAVTHGDSESHVPGK
uniref:Putative secreted protein n=1 Tax=Amblyomma triste TaxID=251400 RepID=A0A023G5R6_AMBTT